MLSIRMQRTGRKGLPHYRLVVQDSRRAPNSGRIVAQLGSYNPHTKNIVLDKEKAQEFVNNGAHPSPRVTSILKSEGLKLPAWVKQTSPKKSATKNPEKLRKNQPKQEAESVEQEEQTPAPAEA